MQMQELASVGGKTTMRIGGQARLFSQLLTKDDAEEAVKVSTEKNLPLIVLGSGSNTVFSDGIVEALVVRIGYGTVAVEDRPASAEASAGLRVTVGAGANLAMLIGELAKKGLDLSPLTGIPGTVGGAIFGNAGQGPKGVWIDSFVESVTAYVNNEWKTLTKEECDFTYRESGFKRSHEARGSSPESHSPIIWEVTLKVPTGDPAAIQANVQKLLHVRIDTQPHLKTAGSCFKAIGGTPAWKLIDAAGLRGTQVGGVQIAEKHANFLLNTGNATYSDAVAIVKKVKDIVKEPLDVEMRFIEPDGSLKF